MKIKIVGDTMATNPTEARKERKWRFMSAVGSLANIYPAAEPVTIFVPGGFNTDQAKMSGDWYQVGDDLRFGFQEEAEQRDAS